MLYDLNSSFKKLHSHLDIEIFNQDYAACYFVEGNNPSVYIEELYINNHLNYFLIKEINNDKEIKKISNNESQLYINQFKYRPLRYIRYFCKVENTYCYLYNFERYGTIIAELLPYTENNPSWLLNCGLIDKYKIWSIIKRYPYN